jgi:hypothetical protein
MMTMATVEVPLAYLNPGTGNSFKITIPGPGDNWETYTQFYGFTFRIYYDPAKKTHVSGTIATPASGSKLGKSVDMSVNVQGTATEVQYIGNYEDLDYNGDGVYDGWVYSYRHSEMIGNIGTATNSPFNYTWNTSWIADPPKPMQIAARIIDANGLVYMTQAVDNLSFSRGNFSVELCKPYGVLNGFSTCTYGQGDAYTGEQRNKTEYFKVKGEISDITDAKFFFECWRRASDPRMKLNGTDMNLSGVDGGSQFVTQTLNPQSALKADSNTLVLTNASDGGCDIEWPGIQFLIQYSTPVHIEKSGVVPNPALPFSIVTDDRFVSVRTAERGPYRIGIHNAAGAFLAGFSGEGSRECRFDCSHFAPGMYVLDLEASSLYAQKKLMFRTR